VVSEGLKDGEQVIVEGVNKVRPGMEVDAAPAAGG
jgi:membrane fusion protein (multidrug efflux system)